MRVEYKDTQGEFFRNVYIVLFNIIISKKIQNHTKMFLNRFHVCNLATFLIFMYKYLIMYNVLGYTFELRSYIYI
jgi:hypothetical protein